MCLQAHTNRDKTVLPWLAWDYVIDQARQPHSFRDPPASASYVLGAEIGGMSHHNQPFFWEFIKDDPELLILLPLTSSTFLVIRSIYTVLPHTSNIYKIAKTTLQISSLDCG